MKKILMFLLMVSCYSICDAQTPVKWSYSAKKIEDKKYEVTITATVQSPWHIYSQFTPEGGPLPTSFSFNKNPLVELDGKVKELGKIIKKYEDVFEVDVKYFDGSVQFIQKLKLKAKVKTNLTGSLEYMACNDEQCLPPATVNFSIAIQ